MNLSELQSAFPLLFKDTLGNYIQLIEYIIDNPESFESDYTLKAAVICLTWALKKYSNKPQKPGNYEEIRQQCVSSFYQLFTVERIENFFNIFLLKLLPRRLFLTNDQDTNNLDDYVEIGISFIFVLD